MKRRTPGEGWIQERPKRQPASRYVGAISLGYKNGKRRRRWFYGPTADAVRKKITAEKARLDAGEQTDLDNLKLTLEKFARRWLKAIAPDIKPKTLASYTGLLEQHIFPALGKKRIRSISRTDIKALLLHKRTSGKTIVVKNDKDEKTKQVVGLSKNTVRLIRATLSAMYADALDEGLAPTNPAIALSRRRGAKRGDSMSAAERLKSIRPFTADELAKVLNAAREHEAGYSPAFLFLARTGARPGEAIALKWSDLNFERREVLIERGMSLGEIGTTKTGVTRTVDLSQELVDTLKLLRIQREKDKLSEGWPEMPEWVFINGENNPLDESRLRKRFANAMKKAGISGHRVYDLRHTWATLMLAKGVPITYVAAQLGHSKPSTTLQWYARWLPQDSKAYVDALDVRLPRASNIMAAPTAKPMERLFGGEAYSAPAN
jgi:integrase